MIQGARKEHNINLKKREEMNRIKSEMNEAETKKVHLDNDKKCPLFKDQYNRQLWYYFNILSDLGEKRKFFKFIFRN